jgi:putative ABC transport system ATP-binding protein
MSGAPGDAPLVALRGVGKAFQRGVSNVAALRDVTLEIGTGELVAVIGPSGSGKSTLLNIVGGLDRPTAGEYWLDGRLVSALSDAELSRLRNRSIGFVFQAFHLIPQLSVVENVETPLIYSGLPMQSWRARAWHCLERVGLTHRAQHRPAELSGGEAQRAALARALVLEPRLLLADEPTGNLDSATGEEIAQLLRELHADGHTVVLVTHNERLARHAPRVIALRDGAIESGAS